MLSIKLQALSMELLQTLLDWEKCVKIWEMPWADPHGCQCQTSHSRQFLEKELSW